MITVPNLLSLLRGPLALAFLSTNPSLRFLAIILAMVSDGLDGFIARRYKMTSRFGTFLDPLMDKFFVIFAACTLIYEERLTLLEAAALISRDFAVLLFGIYLALTKRLKSYQFRSIFSGKISTCLQFFVLLALTLEMAIPTTFYTLFILLGLLALFELFISQPAVQKLKR